MHLRAAALLLAASVLSFAACRAEDDAACEAGDQRACTCDAGARGYQTCAADDRGYGACVCAEVAPDAGDAGDAGDGGPEGGGLKMFMDLCDKNEECVTGLCEHYNAKPARCSRACAGAADCPPPSTGCNGMGICKSP